MAGERKAVGNHAKQITEKNKYKNRKNKWKISPTLFTNIVADHFSDKLIR